MAVSEDEDRRTALAERAARVAATQALGIDDAFVERLVETFYGHVQADPMLGPIFAERVADWPPHLERMKRFWRSILFASGEYQGRPMPAHIAIPGLGPAQFHRWLGLFHHVLAELGASPAATALVGGKARQIAQGMLTGIAVHHHGLAGARAGDALR